MNIMINTKTSLSLFFVLASLVACDDDAKKYTAEFPRFEPLQLKLAENELPKVGKSVVVEAPQRKMGKHLYEVTYQWTVSGPAEAVQRYGKSNLNTEHTPAPTDTITFSQSGRYNIVLVASYEVSGIGKGQSFTENFPAKMGSAKYDGSALRYRVTLERTIDVDD